MLKILFVQGRGLIFSDGDRHRETRTFSARFFAKHGLKSLTKGRTETDAKFKMREELAKCVKEYIDGTEKNT